MKKLIPSLLCVMLCVLPLPAKKFKKSEFPVTYLCTRESVLDYFRWVFDNQYPEDKRQKLIDMFGSIDAALASIIESDPDTQRQLEILENTIKVVMFDPEHVLVTDGEETHLLDAKYSKDYVVVMEDGGEEVLALSKKNDFITFLYDGAPISLYRQF